jgi:hypothetical protein
MFDRHTNLYGHGHTLSVYQKVDLYVNETESILLWRRRGLTSSVSIQASQYQSIMSQFFDV